MTQGFRALDQSPPDNLQEHTRYLQKIRSVVNNLMQGKRNSVLIVTLTANAASTVVQDPRIGGDTAIHLSPYTANAAAEVGAGGLYIDSYGEETATIHHANNAQTDRIFRASLDG